MAYDLEEQEQIATLKSWWKTYGNLVTWTLIVVLSAYSAWTGWQYYQRNQAQQAAQLYDEMERAVDSKDAERIQRIAADLKDKFGRTDYAQMGALAHARQAFDQRDLATAKSELQWVIKDGKNAEYQAVARIRLAGILLDEKAYDEGLKLLAAGFPTNFVALASDRKGDLLAAQGKRDEARKAWQEALDRMGAAHPGRQLIQIKLDALGGTPANA